MSQENRLEIYCKIEYIGLDADGHLYIELSKKNKRALTEIAKVLKETYEGKETYLLLDLGRWEDSE